MRKIKLNLLVFRRLWNASILRFFLKKKKKKKKKTARAKARAGAL